ncbi:MAG: Rieske 2Fe-2S domain-containing protein [Lautropia sp.]
MKSEEAKVDFPATTSPYRRAATGFKEYWYPVCPARKVRAKPISVVLLGQPVALMRREGKAYAIADECPHRGTPLSAGVDEFPGTATIVCPYHGWTFDVRSGVCVGVLCEGPTSKAIGRARVRTFPLEERKGIIWIWMGRSGPVPLEDDVPRLLLSDSAVVKVRAKKRYGNWRWHAENVGGGHAQIVHRNALWHWFQPPVAYPETIEPRVIEDADGTGLITGYRFYSESRTSGDYGVLGQWPKLSPFRRLLSKLGSHAEFKPIEQITESMLRLPGCYRVLHYPVRDSIYYEWWVPVDEDHYVYFQVTTAHPKTVWQRILFELRYYVWGRVAGLKLFNDQDAEMVTYTTDYVKRRDWVHHSSLTRQDEFHALWRKHCDAHARGVGTQLRAAPIDR